MKGKAKITTSANKNETPLVLLSHDPRSKNRECVGGKSSSLSELMEISKVPPAFFITTEAYSQYIENNQFLTPLIKELDSLSSKWIKRSLTTKNNLSSLEEEIRRKAMLIRKRVLRGKMPSQLTEEISKHYTSLCKKMKQKNMPVAVRSSGVAEDMPGASFAGQYDTFLNQKGIEQVLSAVKMGFASQFTNRVVDYRNTLRFEIAKSGDKNSNGLSHTECKIAIAVQVMIDSATSGVAFSIEPETASPFFSIEMSYGLGEALVSGEVTPDSFLVDPNTNQIVERTLGEKEIKIIYSAKGGTKTVKTSKKESRAFCVDDKKVRDISTEISKIASHYETHVDVEFGFDKRNRLWIFQARAETVASKKDSNVIEMQGLVIKKGADTRSAVMSSGKTGSPGVGIGRVLIAKSVDDAIKNLKKGDVLVTEMTTPDWNPVLHLPSAVITDVGGANCHAAIISRERGIPCLVGTGSATKTLKSLVGTEVTVDASNSLVYEGVLPTELVGENINVKKIVDNQTKTSIGLIVSNPETARKMYALRQLGNNFIISLLRIEFLLTEIGVHPRALEDYDKGNLADKDIQKRVSEKIAGYKSGKDYYIKKLSEGIAQFAAVFPDSPVTVRTTDFKTNEYSNLIGGDLYEAEEANPMMGWRGLIRSLSPENQTVTKWEFKAIKKARDMGYKNIKIFFPVVRDPVELTGSKDLTKLGYKGVFELMKEAGLSRRGLKVGMMVEVPTNAIIIDKFLDAGLDFISFGTNDLTQFTLAVDRDGNEAIQQIPHYREGNLAVVELVRQVIRACRKRGVETGICGQAPSNDPKFVKMLVEAGVGSIGVMPDRYLATYKLVKKAEKSK